MKKKTYPSKENLTEIQEEQIKNLQSELAALREVLNLREESFFRFQLLSEIRGIKKALEQTDSNEESDTEDEEDDEED